MGGNLSTVQELVRQKYVERNNDKGFLVRQLRLPQHICAALTHHGVLN